MRIRRVFSRPQLSHPAMRPRAQFAAFAAFALLSLPVPAWATPPDGSLDPSFGSGGKVVTDVGGYGGICHALLPLDGGRFLAAGIGGPTYPPSFFVACYLADGTLDATFGTNGFTATEFSQGAGRFTALALQPDGKIVGVGYLMAGDDNDIAVARYEPNGTLDPTFGDGGTATIDFYGKNDFGVAVALQPDGKIVVASTVVFGDPGARMAVLRFNTNGELDPAFGDGGKVEIDFGPLCDAYAVAVQPDGKIVVGGDGRIGPSWDVAIARLNPDGRLDASFGDGGKMMTDFAGRGDEVTALAILPDRKILAVGSAQQAAGDAFAILRLNPDGTLDPYFGQGGKATADFFAGYDEALALAVQPDGKAVVAGYTSSGDPTATDFAMARFNYDGTLDPSFGVGGLVTTDFDGRTDAAAALIFVSDGRLVVGGYSAGPTHSPDFAFACYASESGLGVTNAKVKGQKLTVYGAHFDAGAAIFIDGVRVKTVTKAGSAETTLVAKKGGKKVPPGQTVTITVQNADGRTSNVYHYRRP